METSVGVPSPTGNEHFQIPLNFWLSEAKRFLRASSARCRLVSKNTVYSSVIISKWVLSKHAAAGRSKRQQGGPAAPVPSGSAGMKVGGWAGGCLCPIAQLRRVASAMDGAIQGHRGATVRAWQVLQNHLALLLTALTNAVFSGPAQGVNQRLRRSISDD